MLFNSIRYLLFFPFVVLVYYKLPQKGKPFFLLCASYFFYMNWNPKYALLLLLSTGVTYLSGLLLDLTRVKIGNPTERVKLMKWIVFSSLTINLGILFVFKYFNFSVELIRNASKLLGHDLKCPEIDVLLPVGISFYTFQAIGYTIDVFRGSTKAEKNFIVYALFVSFFPQLVAGPIERSGRLLGQLKTKAQFEYERFCDGILLLLWGYCLKIVIADRIAIFVDAVYADPTSSEGMHLIIATMLFAFQIYCDFAGYSTIAVGSAKILGIDLIENFKAPYLVVSVQEFWRNWHISLTSWFRDYLYIPLGGGRKGIINKYRNVIIVFLLSGLWHGASLAFVVWGLLNSIYQVAGSIMKPLKEKLVRTLHINRQNSLYRMVCSVWVFLLVDFSWIFFRSGNIRDAILVLHQIGTSKLHTLFDGSVFEYGLNKISFLFVGCSLLLLLATDICKKRGIQVRKIILEQRPWVRIVVTGVAMFLVALFGCWGPEFDEAGFIYFQF